jgi:cytochrome c oxidase subunit 2
MKHLIAGFIVVIVLMVLGFIGLQIVWQQGALLPLQASLQAIPIDNLFRVHFSAIVVLFSLIIGLMVYSIIVFRRRKGDMTDGPHSEGSMALEVAWTVIPLGFVLFLAFLGSVALGETQAAEPRALRVNAIGSQWAWRFEYPDLGINSTELILPEDRQALLTLSSTDVIHSFWVPEFRVKQDLLPGEGFDRQIRITPDRVGEYKVRCAEMCGRLHYNMEAPIKILSQADYDAWVQSQIQPVSSDPVVRGDQLTQQFGCRACHSIDGTVVVGPSWKGLYGNQEALADGTSATVDDAYLTESIRDPGAKITAGFQNLMPATIGAELTDEQIADIIAFIASLK